MDYLDTLVGAVEMPQLGWVLQSDRRGACQKKYQLQVAKDSECTELLYASGEVSSSESAHILLDTVQLDSATAYYVRVRVQDELNDWSDWCENSFITGLIPKPAGTAKICNTAAKSAQAGGIRTPWQADFISAETEADAENSKGTYVRTEFTAKGKIASAYAFTTALGLYHCYINGKKVGTDEMTPGWTTYHKRLLYQSYEVTDLLQQGANAIGAHVGAGWYKGLMGFNLTRNLYGKQTAFSAELHITYTNGTKEIIATNPSWKASDSPVLFSEIYDGEVYDATKEQAGWHMPAFDDSTWRAVNEVVFDTSLLDSQSGTRVTKVEEVKPVELINTPDGDTVIDFGQNLTGWVEFSVQGHVGDTVEVNCFEVLDANGNVYTENLRAAKETLLYHCRGTKHDTSVRNVTGTEHWETYRPNFTFQGFRYAKIAQYPQAVKLNNFTAYAVHSDMPRTGYFNTSHPKLNQLQHNILWGLKGNFLDIPTDCPQRDERLGWTGDAQIFCRTATFLMNTHSFFRKWLKDVALDQTPEGGVPHVVPDILEGHSKGNWLLSQGTHSAAAWADVAVIAPWVLYLSYGDKQIIYEQYDSMKGWVDFMHAHANDGIWNYQLQFGDWVALDAEEGSHFGATPNELTCAAYYAYSTEIFAKMAQIIGKHDVYQEYHQRHTTIVEAFQRHFFTQSGDMTAQTQTAHILALYFNLVAPKHREKIATQLVKLIAKEGGHLVTGFVGTPYICHALSQNGKVKEAYDLLLTEEFPSWLFQVNMGATTIWEHWDGIRPDGTMWSAGMNSFNHYAYGAIGEWLYRVIGGFEVDTQAPGYKHAIIAPTIGGGLSYAKTHLETVYGRLCSHWQVAEGSEGAKQSEVTLMVEVPVNTTATVILKDATQVQDTDGVTFTPWNDSYTTGFAGKVASGSYTFRFLQA